MTTSASVAAHHEQDAVVVDFEVTSEKMAMGWRLDGRVLPNGAAFISDVA